MLILRIDSSNKVVRETEFLSKEDTEREESDESNIGNEGKGREMTKKEKKLRLAAENMARSVGRDPLLPETWYQLSFEVLGDLRVRIFCFGIRR